MDYKTLQAKVKALRELGIETPALNSKKAVLEEFLAQHTASVNSDEEKFLEETLDTSNEVSYTESNEVKEVTTMVKAKKVNGVILFEGISSIDNVTPIVVIATGLTTKTANPKTGNMIQTWILLRDEFPTEALNNGNDAAICGNCPHRKYDGKRSCYVNPMSFSSVYKAYKKGNYPHYEPAIHDKYFQGRAIRYGSYGEPINIPTEIINHLNSITTNHTGYTHQWRNSKFSEYRKYFMASVDSLFDFLEAKDAGWSTFRVHGIGDEITDISCQGGVKTTCTKCTLCNGNTEKQRHVGIIAHGSGSKYVKVM